MQRRLHTSGANKGALRSVLARNAGDGPRTRKDMLDQIHAQFIGAVKSGPRQASARDDPELFLRHVLDGREERRSWVSPTVSATPTTWRAK